MRELDRSLRQPWMPRLESAPRDLPQVSGVVRLKRPGVGREVRAICRGMDVVIRRYPTGRIVAGDGSGGVLN